MKLEKEPEFPVQTPPRKSYNPFDSDDEETNGFVQSSVNPYDVKSFEKSADSLTFHLDNGDMSWEEAILANVPIHNHSIPADASGEEVIFRKDTELFTDKTVTECELPELMVCYKENGYNSVKDIGIDEGVPVHEKVWIRSNNDDSKTHPSFLVLNGSTNGHLTVGNEHQELPFIEGLKSRPDNHLEKDVMKNGVLGSEDVERQHSSDQCGTDDSVKVDDVEHDLRKKESNSGDVVYDTRDHKLSETNGLNYVKAEIGRSEVPEEEEHGKDNVSLVHLKESSTNPSIINGEEATESTEGGKEESISPQSLELPTSQESADSSVANALSYNSKVESGSIILDFNSSTTTSKEEEEEKEKEQQNVADEKVPETQTPPVEKVQETQAVPIEKPPETQLMSRNADGALDLDRRVHGETSFSADMPLPASITYMGPNARLGSISLRSESSAGSTRSFAFPVLQAEWNSSPVRMAKAEQRNFRKHRGWVHSVMCCRF